MKRSKKPLKRKSYAERYLSGKTRKELKKICWDYFSLYIRLKYANSNGCVQCFTCSTVRHYKHDLAAGHYLNASHCGDELYIHELNVHPQCNFSCNKNKSGNKTEYERKLKDKYGSNIINKLHAIRSKGKKFTYDDWVKHIVYYKEKSGELLNNLAIYGTD